MWQQKDAANIPPDTTMANFYEKHAPPIFAYLRMHTTTHEDADDLLVEIFLKALEYSSFNDLSEREQRAWLWRVTRNRVIDYYRKTYRRQMFSLEAFTETPFQDMLSDPEQSILRQEEYAQLRVHISKLSAMQQNILQLHFIYGLRSTEIALVLGKRDGAVRALLARALNTLRRLYEHNEEQRHEKE